MYVVVILEGGGTQGNRGPIQKAIIFLKGLEFD